LQPAPSFLEGTRGQTRTCLKGNRLTQFIRAHFPWTPRTIRRQEWHVACLAILVWSLIPASVYCFQGSSPDTQKTLADLAREWHAKKQNQVETAPGNSPSIPSSKEVDEKEQEYRAEVRALVSRRAFAQLDQAAAQARSSKERVGGGYWKLYVLYQVAEAPASGRGSDQVAWLDHLSFLRNWVETRPQSITARIAQAAAYERYAWMARGGEYAYKVKDAQWKLFYERVDRAYEILEEAAQLRAKCPHWYFVMLSIATDQGWKKDKTRALFEQAIAFEPDYYHYYRPYTNYLQTKWYGEPGEVEAFAEETSARIGGRKGAFVYFKIASFIYCWCNDPLQKPTLLWPRIQEGFAEVDSQYGATTLDLNRFAFIAFLYRDRETARRVLARVGDNWDATVWQEQGRFEQARLWAGLPNP
jgi:hypothetical protein